MRIKPFISTIIALTVFICIALCGCERKQDAAAKSQVPQAPEQVQSERVKKNREEAKNTIAARVNGSPITMYSLVQKMNLIAPHFIKPGQSSGPQIDNKIKQLALERLIFEELAVQEARRQGFIVKKEAVDDVIKRIKAGYGSEKEYKGYLETLGMTEDTLRETIERGHLIEMITAKEVYGIITADETALRVAYEKDKSKFITGNPPRQLTFEEARVFLERKIKSEEGAEKLKAWEKELKKKAKIEVKSETVRS
jgi:SurA N-terminal domain